MEFFRKLFSSLDNHTPGYSGRKISSAIGVSTAVFLAAYRAPESAIESIINTFLIFSSVCLGLVTIPQIIEFFTNKKGTGTITETVKTEVTKESTSTEIPNT